MSFRTEKDPLGEKQVPADALYGIQTLRAVENFPVSGLRPLPAFVDAVIWIKKAAALTHKQTGRLEPRLADAIVRAADEILAGKHRDQFVVDVYQAGAGTSHNMNANEVLANRANEILGSARGTYAPVHPNDHVNMAQSTNDVIPTAMRLGDPGHSSRSCSTQCSGWSRPFWPRGGSSTTSSSPAAPISRTPPRSGSARSSPRGGTPPSGTAPSWWRPPSGSAKMNIGGTAVGTGLNAEPEYPRLMVEHLCAITRIELREGKDRIQLMQSMGDIATMSGAVRGWALDLNKIANDIRLLASGPRTGLAEILCPAVQPGSSIMPGKVNPSIAEMVNQVCYQVIGLDTTVAMASEAGQLELNVMMPVIAHNIVFALIILGNAVRIFDERCIRGIEADAAQAAYWLERSPALVTALAPKLGYADAAALAKEAVASGLTVKELVVKKQLLKGAELEDVLNLRAMTELGVPGGKGTPRRRLSPGARGSSSQGRSRLDLACCPVKKPKAGRY